MLGRTYDNQNCSAARALEVVGERWSLLIVRDALFRGINRFADFQRSLGIATNVLATRLESLVTAGMLEKIVTDDEGRFEYRLTEKGTDMLPVVVALTKWGDRWAAPHGPPILYTHDCGGALKYILACSRCGPVRNADVRIKPGPGNRHEKTRGSQRSTVT